MPYHSATSPQTSPGSLATPANSPVPRWTIPVWSGPIASAGWRPDWAVFAAYPFAFSGDKPKKCLQRAWPSRRLASPHNPSTCAARGVLRDLAKLMLQRLPQPWSAPCIVLAGGFSYVFQRFAGATGRGSLGLARVLPAGPL